MKKILFILGISAGLATAANAQEIQDAKRNTKAYVDPSNHTLMDKNKKLLCTFEEDGKILDTKSRIIGYIDGGHELRDKNKNLVGYIMLDGTIQKADRSLMGKVSSTGSGPVLDNMNNVVGHVRNIEPMWAAAYFFLLNY